MHNFINTLLGFFIGFFSGQRKQIHLNKTFLDKQCKMIQNYVAQYPAHEKQQRAIEWIEKYAHQYRLAWEKDNLKSL